MPEVSRNRIRRPLRARPPAPPAAGPWRWAFPLVLVALAAATLVLSLHGSRVVLDSRDGTLVPSEQDPTQPGYVALVEPTPTMLVAHNGPGGELISAVVLTLGAEDKGGWAVVFPPDLVVEVDDESVMLGDVHERHGPDEPGGVRTALESLLGAALDEVVTVDAASLESLIGPVAPLRFSLADDVVTVRDGQVEVLLERGEVSVATEAEIQAATEVLGPGEAPAARQVRQLAFWQAWTGALRSLPDPQLGFPVPAAEGTLPGFLAGLASGVARLELAPVHEVAFDGVTLVAPDREQTEELAARMIPFPVGAEPGDRVIVDLRNGTGDLELNEPVARALVGAGAQISVLGNAQRFDVDHTTVAYHDPAERQRAERLAGALGGAEVVLDERPESAIDVTVTIGQDYGPARQPPTASG